MLTYYIMAETLRNALKEKRPNLSDSSLKTYISYLNAMYKSVYPDDKEIDIRKFNNAKTFIDHLQNLDFSKRKSRLSPLYVLTGNDEYRQLMMNDAKQYEQMIEKNEKSDKQEKNWVSQDSLKSIFETHQKQANELFKHTKLTMNQLQNIQNYIILCLTSGMFIPPRRSLDFTELKFRNYDKNIDNVYDKKQFIFNKYKTAKKYGEQTVTIPTELKKILNKWIKVVPDSVDYILFDSNGSKLTNVKLTQRLNRIFGKNASVNILRHSYISNMYQNTKLGDVSIADMKDIASEMGHSFNTQLEYIKK